MAGTMLGHIGKQQCRVTGSMPGDDTTPYLLQQEIGNCRLSRMSLGTCSFSTWKPCSGSTWGFGMLIQAPEERKPAEGLPHDLQPLASLSHPSCIPSAGWLYCIHHEAEPYQHMEAGTNHHHAPLPSCWVPHPLPLGKKAILYSLPASQTRPGAKSSDAPRTPLQRGRENTAGMQIKKQPLWHP